MTTRSPAHGEVHTITRSEKGEGSSMPSLRTWGECPRPSDETPGYEWRLTRVDVAQEFVTPPHGWGAPGLVVTVAWTWQWLPVKLEP